MSRGRAPLLAIVASVLALADAAAGSPTINGRTSGAEGLTSAAWGASASPMSFTWNLVGGSHTATVANTGTVALAAITYTVTVSTGTGVTTFTLAACSVPWSLGLCNGGAGTAVGGTYAIGSSTHASSTVVPPVGGDVYLQATSAGLVLSSITMTLSLAVTGSSTAASDQARPALTTSQ